MHKCDRVNSGVSSFLLVKFYQALELLVSIISAMHPAVLSWPLAAAVARPVLCLCAGSAAWPATDAVSLRLCCRLLVPAEARLR